MHARQLILIACLAPQLLAEESNVDDSKSGPPIAALASNPDRERKMMDASKAQEEAKALPPGDAKRRELIDNLASMLGDADDAVRSSVRERLAYSFEEQDYSADAKEKIVRDFRANPERKTAIITAGIAAFDTIKDDLTIIAAGELKEPEAGRYYGTTVWAASMMLGRNGDDVSVGRLLQAARKEADIVVKATVLPADLRLVPHPKVVEFLVELAMSNERLPQVKPTAPGTPVASRALKVLSEMLPTFPAIKEFAAITEDELRISRRWLSIPSNLKLKPSVKQ
jgi:hypothetical protein